MKTDAFVEIGSGNPSERKNMADKKELSELWAGFAKAALQNFTPAEDVEDSDELADDMVEISTKYADSMLDEYEERFGASGRSGGRRRKKSAGDDE